jgi:hypothetical protein
MIRVGSPAAWVSIILITRSIIIPPGYIPQGCLCITDAGLMVSVQKVYIPCGQYGTVMGHGKNGFKHPLEAEQLDPLDIV